MSMKPGRPKKAQDKARAPGISFRLTSDEAKPINEAISISGLKRSDCARKALIYVAAGD